MTQSKGSVFDPMEELSRSEARVVVKLEFRRFRKPVTIIEGISDSRLRNIARDLKRRFGAGGSVKGMEILIQGDRREHVREELVRLGFAEDHIVLI